MPSRRRCASTRDTCCRDASPATSSIAGTSAATTWHDGTLQSRMRSGFSSRRRWQSAHSSRAARRQGGPDRLLVAGAVLGVAEVVEVDHQIVEPQPQEELVHRRQQLGVGERRVGADDLQADLGELPVPPVLHPLVAEHRPEVVQAQRVGAVAEAVLDPRPGHAGGPFGPQRERAALAVGEGVHLLVDDVGGLADRAHEQLGRPRTPGCGSRRRRTRRRPPGRPPPPPARGGLSGGSRSRVPRGRWITRASPSPRGRRARARRRPPGSGP